MKIQKVTENKKQYLSLLLLADEQESLIDGYLDRGMMYVLVDVDDNAICECVVTDEGNGVLEIQSIATAPAFHGKGYGRAMIEFLIQTYRGQFSVLRVGTGDSPLTIPFYEACGFVRAYVIPGYFLTHYDHPIYEAGVLLVDKIYLEKTLS